LKKAKVYQHPMVTASFYNCGLSALLVRSQANPGCLEYTVNITHVCKFVVIDKVHIGEYD
jgi:hypothetical protein